MITVQITWMDGKQETYRCASLRTIDGVLYLNQNHFPASDDPNRAFPLANIRTWTVPS